MDSAPRRPTERSVREISRRPRSASVLQSRLLRRCRPSMSMWLLCGTCLGCTESARIAASMDFEGGAAEHVRMDFSGNIRFSVPADPVGGERLWFLFRVTSPQPIRPWFIIDGDPPGSQGNWDVTRPVFSADGSDWVRAEEVRYDPPSLVLWFGRRPGFRFRAPVAGRDLRVAYFYPYTGQDLQRFLARLEGDDRVKLSVLGRSEEGRAIEAISIDERPPPPSNTRQVIWIICREHPGETPASFALEGVINALLHQVAGRALLSKYAIRIVPILNVDGVARGNDFRNRRGIDLAEDWGSFRSSEVRALYGAMREDLAARRVALVLDLHSANDPRSHYFLETPQERLSRDLPSLQRRLLQAAAGAHPQLQVTTTVKLWEHPEIAGNYLNAHFGVYCLYLETNYSVGADGTLVTRESLREVGAALVRVLARVLVEGS